MSSYSMKCRKNTESKNRKVVKTKNGRIMSSQNKQCMILKKQNLSKSMKLAGY